MTAAAERQIQEQTHAFELVDHSMTRITVLGNGTYDEFQARFDAAMPASTPQDLMGAAGNWKNAVTLVESKASFGLLIYRKGDVYSVMKMAGAYYLIGDFTAAQPAYVIDSSVFLYFPFHVCLWEGTDGRPRVSFDLPSSAIAIFQNEAMSKGCTRLRRARGSAGTFRHSGGERVMIDLLQRVLAAHGGLDRWNTFKRVSATILSGGELWAAKGIKVDAIPRRVTAGIDRAWTTVAPYDNPDWRMTFVPERVAIETSNNSTLGEHLFFQRRGVPIREVATGAQIVIGPMSGLI
jgi:hypothetical protein